MRFLDNLINVSISTRPSFKFLDKMFARTQITYSIIKTSIISLTGTEILRRMTCRTIFNFFYFFFPVVAGARNKNILFPSSFGNCSTLLISASASANLSNIISPFSLYAIVLPLKWTSGAKSLPDESVYWHEMPFSGRRELRSFLEKRWIFHASISPGTFAERGARTIPGCSKDKPTITVESRSGFLARSNGVVVCWCD